MFRTQSSRISPVILLFWFLTPKAMLAVTCTADPNQKNLQSSSNIKISDGVREKALLSFRASPPCWTSRGICLLHCNQVPFFDQVPNGLVTSHTPSDSAISRSERELIELRSDLEVLRKKIEELERNKLNDISNKMHENSELLNLLSQKVDPLLQLESLFVRIVSVGVAIFGILIAVAMAIWQKGLKQVLTDRVRGMGDEVKDHVNTILEDYNALYRDCGSAALEALLGSEPKNLHVRDCFSSCMLILSTDPRKVRSGCLNLRNLHIRNVGKTQIAKPVLDKALAYWRQYYHSLRLISKNRDQAKTVIKDIQDTIEYLSQPPEKSSVITTD